jgi:hypothetical protein
VTRRVTPARPARLPVAGGHSMSEQTVTIFGKAT